MAQHDYSIANQGFPATRADINNVLSAIATNNSGTSAPSTQYAGQFWIDTTSSTWTLYIHDGADDIQFATIDTSANTVNFIDSELGDNSVTTAKIADGNVTSAKLSYPLTTFSSTGIDDNATSTAITIDSSENVGIGTSSPDRLFHIEGSVPIMKATDTDGGFSEISFSAGQMNFRADDGNNVASSKIGFEIDGTERMRIDSSGNVGIGNTVASTINSANGTGNLVVGSGSGTEGITIYSGTTGEGTLQFADASTGAGTYVGQINYNHSSNFMSFGTNNSEAMRIDSSGILLVGKTSSGIINQGGQIHSEGYGGFTVSGNVALYVNRLVDDGELVRFFQDTNLEGNISVSGSTVSYNGFTGTHWSRFTDNSKPTILKGTVLETLDEMCDWYNLEFDVVTQDDDGNDIITPQKIPHVLIDSQSNGDVITYNHEGTDYQATIVKEADVKHMKSKVSDTVDAKNVYGVFSAYDEDGEGYNDFYVASVGSFVVRIKANETIAKGDLLQSNGDGTAKVQTDDPVRSSSFAKVLSTTIIETYEDGSYLVPCSLMC